MIKAKKLVEILVRGVTEQDVSRAEKEIMGKSESGESIKLPTVTMLDRALVQKYIQEGKQEVHRIMQKEPKKNQVVLMGLTSKQYFLQGYLRKNVVIGFDTTKDISSRGKSLGVYTASPERIIELFKAGAFSEAFGEDEVEKVLETLEKKRAKALLSATEAGGCAVAMVRLDLENVLGDEAEFAPRIPQSFNLGIDKDFFLYPYAVYPYIAEKLKEQSKGVRGSRTPYKVVQIKRQGEGKKRILTFSESLVKDVYRICDKTLVDEKIRGVRIGWDPFSLGIKAYNLESSLYAQGYTVIRLEMLRGIKPGTLGDVDKTQYDVNYSNLHGIFKTKVSRWTMDDFEKFTAFPELAEKERKAERLDYALKRANELSGEELYRVMNSGEFRDLFDDVEQGLLVREKNTPVEIKSMTPVDLADDPFERAEQLRDLLDRGAVKLTRTSSSSSAEKTDICTMNQEVLRRTLGKNYIEKYESPGVKLRYLQLLIETEKLPTGEALTKKIYEMGATKYIDISEIDTAAYDAGDRKGALEIVEKGKDAIRKPNRAKNELNIMYKKLDPSNEKDLYRSLDVRHIISASFGEYVPRKRSS